MPQILRPDVLNFLFLLIGPEIVGFGSLNGPPYRETYRKRWGSSPPTFSNGFPVGGGRLDPKPCRFMEFGDIDGP